MKNKLKRLIVLVLAMSMCLSLLSTVVWAGELKLSEDGSASPQNLEESAIEETISQDEENPAQEVASQDENGSVESESGEKQTDQEVEEISESEDNSEDVQEERIEEDAELKENDGHHREDVSVSEVSSDSSADESCSSEDDVLESLATEGVFGKREDGVYVGELGENNELDGYHYQWADGSYTSFAANELSECILSNDYRVVYKLENGKIAKFARLKTILNPTIQIFATPDSFRYENGKYNCEKIEAVIRLSCKMSRYCPFSHSELWGIEGLEYTISQIEYNLDSNLLNFGKTGFIFKQTLSQKYDNNIAVTFGKDVEITHDVYINNEIIPDSVNTIVNVEGKIKDGKGDPQEVGRATITVGNVDLQKRLAEEKKNTLAFNTELKELKAQLSSNSVITTDPSLSNIFTSAQIDQIEQFLTLYFCQIINAKAYKENGFFSWLSEKIRDRIEDQILGKLGVRVNPGVLLFSKSTDFRVSVKGTSKTGTDVTVEFYGTIDNYQAGHDVPWGSMVEIHHKIINMDAVPPGTQQTGVGMATFYNLESFANHLLSALKIGYSAAWGSDADQIASMIIAKPINELLFNGSFTDGVYDFTVNAVKDSTYRYSIHCPVDVYVYDEDGRLCGSIIDDQIVDTSDAVVLSVCGDQKYVYTAGGTYSLKLLGTDYGEMDYTVEEEVNNQVVRTVKIEDVPLSSSKVYTTIITDIPFADHDIFSLYDGEMNYTYSASSDTRQSIGEKNRFAARWSATCGPDAKLYQYTDGWLEIEGSGAIDETVFINDNYPVDTVLIRDGITSIGEDTFSTCGYSSVCRPLTVIVPDSVKSIGAKAFYCSDRLETLSIGSGLESLGRCAFSYCKSLRQISVSSLNTHFVSEEGILFSKDKTYLYKVPNQNRTSYSIPEGVKTVGFDALGDLTTLQQVVLPSTLKTIAAEAFDGCTGLSQVELPTGLERIDYRAFGGCSCINSVVIPEGVKEIGDEAFLGCTNLHSITIPKSVAEIGSLAVGYSTKTSSWSGQKMDGFIIYGYSGTAAEQYAKKDGFEFVYLDNPTQSDQDTPISDTNKPRVIQVKRKGITPIPENEKVSVQLDGKGEKETVELLVDRNGSEKKGYDTTVTLNINGKKVLQKKYHNKWEKTKIELVAADIQYKDKLNDLVFAAYDEKWSGTYRDLIRITCKDRKVSKENVLKTLKGIQSPKCKKEWDVSGRGLKVNPLESCQGIKKGDLSSDGNGTVRWHICLCTAQRNYFHGFITLKLKNGKLKAENYPSGGIKEYDIYPKLKKKITIYKTAGGSKKAGTIKKNQTAKITKFMFVKKKLYFQVSNKKQIGWIAEKDLKSFIADGTLHT